MGDSREHDIVVNAVFYPNLARSSHIKYCWRQQIEHIHNKRAQRKTVNLYIYIYIFQFKKHKI